MKKLAIVYHSMQGHTEHIAMHIAAGAATVSGIKVKVLSVSDLIDKPEVILDFDGFIFGSPTYLGGVSAAFKSFMDATGVFWRAQQLKDKLAAGFTVSSLPAGDKQSTLLSMMVFAMQHGMIWAGNNILPEQLLGVPYDDAANRLGSWVGMMAQAGRSAPADAFVAGDIKTARLFGQHIAEVLRGTAFTPQARHDGEPVADLLTLS